VQFHFPIEKYRREKTYEIRQREPIPTRSAEERLKDANTQVERGYDPGQAAGEAGRCLDCGINTVFDGERCILCGGCVDVCPTVCLKLVSLDRVETSPDLDKVARRLLGEEALAAPEEFSAIIKDEDRCIRCGLCAQRCPTTAITMERFEFAKNWVPVEQLQASSAAPSA
jgi:ferredoxin